MSAVPPKLQTALANLCAEPVGQHCQPHRFYEALRGFLRAFCGTPEGERLLIEYGGKWQNMTGLETDFAKTWKKTEGVLRRWELPYITLPIETSSQLGPMYKLLQSLSRARESGSRNAPTDDEWRELCPLKSVVVDELIHDAKVEYWDDCSFLLDLHRRGEQSCAYAAITHRCSGPVMAESLQKAAKFLVDQLEFELATEKGATADNDVPGPSGASKMRWQEAAKRMERLRSQGEPYTSQRQLATRLGCSPFTINKAIRNTKSLHGWAKQQALPTAQSLGGMVTDSTPQEQEPDPAEEAAIREFIEKADGETKAWFLALSPEDQLRYLDDPDKHGLDQQVRILGRKP